jgi:hypothetical protein
MESVLQSVVKPFHDISLNKQTCLPNIRFVVARVCIIEIEGPLIPSSNSFTRRLMRSGSAEVK